MLTEAYILTIMDGSTTVGVILTDSSAKIAKEVARYMDGKPLTHVDVVHWQFNGFHSKLEGAWHKLESFRWPA